MDPFRNSKEYRTIDGELTEVNITKEKDEYGHTIITESYRLKGKNIVTEGTYTNPFLPPIKSSKHVTIKRPWITEEHLESKGALGIERLKRTTLPHLKPSKWETNTNLDDI